MSETTFDSKSEVAASSKNVVIAGEPKILVCACNKEREECADCNQGWLSMMRKGGDASFCNSVYRFLVFLCQCSHCVDYITCMVVLQILLLQATSLMFFLTMRLAL